MDPRLPFFRNCIYLPLPKVEVADLHGPFPTSETCPVPPKNMVSQFHNMIHGMHVSVTVSQKSGIPPKKLGGNPAVLGPKGTCNPDF